MRHLIARALLLCATIPVAFIIALVAVYLHARSILGHFPSYDMPDPKELWIYPFYAQYVYLPFVASCISFFIWLLEAVIFLVTAEQRFDFMVVLYGMISYTAAFLLARSEILNWFAD